MIFLNKNHPAIKGYPQEPPKYLPRTLGIDDVVTWSFANVFCDRVTGLLIWGMWSVVEWYYQWKPICPQLGFVIICCTTKKKKHPNIFWGIQELTDPFAPFAPRLPQTLRLHRRCRRHQPRCLVTFFRKDMWPCFAFSLHRISSFLVALAGFCRKSSGNPQTGKQDEVSTVST